MTTGKHQVLELLVTEIIPFVSLAIAMQHLYTFHERVRLSQRNFAHIFFPFRYLIFFIFSENFSSYTLSLFLIFAAVPDTCP